ncbi:MULTISPECIES: DUF4920 domain-containing protein [unclassified Kaistella]|uniref:DUF4920 domain-containing protein n=1 Tax=unclassified Kaistella TaxID=2762626 RepID=UPI002735EABD|nr:MULTISPECIES: DUF4920 domain-containing protein [unclassified Kaistella]MDP2454033.1 DUF4920 domain-containing protein [Kaistella sp. SH11-4b]MDP2457090.1 DUF4920 domain-containing protein [Kaistella sp. SH40-3]MDP2459848.1 DUF4920 domain-containing protein [Kaistella sp. SH19-2b]
MKKLVLLFSIALSTLAFSQESTAKKAGPPEGNATVGEVYGAGVSAKAEKSAMTTKKLDAKLKKSTKLENVAVKGKVVKVCDKKGCWLTVETDNNEKFFVKMKDYAFFVPMALEGKTVVLEGNVETKVTSVDEQKHYAEDAKKPQAEIDAITTPQEEIRFMASGIKVVN